MDRALWKVENYRDFLAARRELLAKAANEFLDSLLPGSAAATAPSAAVMSVLDRWPAPLIQASESDDVQLTREYNDWIAQQGLPPGEPMCEADWPSPARSNGRTRSVAGHT